MDDYMFGIFINSFIVTEEEDIKSFREPNLKQILLNF